jgi:hypothetical protein
VGSGGVVGGVIEDVRGAIVCSLIRHVCWQYRVCAGSFILAENIQDISKFETRKSV